MRHRRNKQHVLSGTNGWNMRKKSVYPDKHSITAPEQSFTRHSVEQRELYKPLSIYQSELFAIKSTIGRLPAETGGMLLGDPKRHLVTKFVFDQGSNQTRNACAYNGDIEFLNNELEKGREEGLDLVGFIHSHPYGSSHLSGEYGDIGYLKNIFSAMPELEYLYSPIVFSTDGNREFQMFTYCVLPGQESNYHQVELKTVTSDRKSKHNSSPNYQQNTCPCCGSLITNETQLVVNQ